MRDTGIDAILDLSARPWGLPWDRTEANVIAGVFEAGKPRATWLILHMAGDWWLLRPADAYLSMPARALRDVLGWIESQSPEGPG